MSQSEKQWDAFFRLSSDQLEAAKKAIAQDNQSSSGPRTCVTITGKISYACGTNDDGSTMICTDDYSVTKCIDGVDPPDWFFEMKK